MPTPSLEEFEQELAREAVPRLRRDRRLGVAFLAALLLALVAILGSAGVLLRPGAPHLPERVSLALVVASAAMLFGTGAYVLATTRAFHRQHDGPRCPSCGRSVAFLAPELASARQLEAVMRQHAHDVRHETLTAAERAEIDAMLTLRCPRCGTCVAAASVSS
jgi:ribosomal protein S27AE